MEICNETIDQFILVNAEMVRVESTPLARANKTAIAVGKCLFTLFIALITYNFFSHYTQL